MKYINLTVLLVVLSALLMTPTLVLPEDDQPVYVYDYYLPAIMVQYGPPASEVIDDLRNVKDFCAVGDGINDDWSAVQNALDQADVIHFPPGTYRITKTLELHDGERKFLYSEGEAVILWDGVNDSVMLDTSQGGSGIIIEGFSFQSNSEGTVGIYAGKDLSWGAHTIRNCRFLSLDVGIDGGSMMGDTGYAYFDSIIDNCVFYNNRIAYDSFGSGVKLTNGSIIANDVGIMINSGNAENASGIFAHGVIFAGNERDIYISSYARIHTFNSCWFETSVYGIVTVENGGLDQGMSFIGCLMDTSSESLMDLTNLEYGVINILASHLTKDNIIRPESVEINIGY